MFETATKKKFRFPYKGMISTEDLWDLKVEELDSIFKSLNSQKKKVNEESLLSVKTDEDKELNMKIDIVKHIVSVKLAEVEERIKAREKKEEKQKLLTIIEAKKNEKLENMSIEELTAMLEKLG